MPSERARLIPLKRINTQDAYGSIREAFRKRDVDASREAHKRERMARAQGSQHAEEHGRSSEFLRSLVFGSMDGLVTMFALIAAAVGSSSDYATVLVFGFAVQFADAIGMGFGDYVSTTAEYEHAVVERNRELWEVENCFDGEVQEMVELYMARGLDEEDAARIVQIMSKKPITFVDFMMIDELGILIDLKDRHRPLKQGLLTCLSFLVASSLPLLVYMAAARSFANSPHLIFLACAVVTLSALGLLGATKGRLTGVGSTRAAVAMMANAVIAGALSYFASAIVTQYAWPSASE